MRQVREMEEQYRLPALELVKDSVKKPAKKAAKKADKAEESAEEAETTEE